MMMPADETQEYQTLKDEIGLAEKEELSCDLFFQFAERYS